MREEEITVAKIDVVKEKYVSMCQIVQFLPQQIFLDFLQLIIVLFVPNLHLPET